MEEVPLNRKGYVELRRLRGLAWIGHPQGLLKRWIRYSFRYYWRLHVSTVSPPFPIFPSNKLSESASSCLLDCKVLTQEANVEKIRISDHAMKRAQLRGVGPSPSGKLQLAAIIGTRIGHGVRILDRRALLLIAKAYPHLSTSQVDDLHGTEVATKETESGSRIVITALPKCPGGARQCYRRNEQYNRKRNRIPGGLAASCP